MVIELRSDLLINFLLGKGSCLQVLKKISYQSHDGIALMDKIRRV